MRRQPKSILVLATITVFMTTALLLPGVVRAGDLQPSNPPGSTMHTLDEIYNIVRDTNSKVVYGECKGAPVAKTGQAESYAAGDDGDLEKGIACPDLRFTDHEDGTVTDNLTSLMWTKNANIYGQRNWTEALSDCASCTEGGYSDWRLANLRELYSLIDYGQFAPALPYGYPFSNVEFVSQCNYWSSTTFAYDTDIVWSVDMTGGYLYHRNKSNGTPPPRDYVWCVRGGQ